MNEVPSSIIHCRFCVTRPRLDVRLRNSYVDSSGSMPARSFARTVPEEQHQHQDARDHQGHRQPTLFTLAARMPSTSTNEPEPPTARPRPCRSGGRVRRQRIREPPADSSTITAMISAWKTNAARQLIAGGDQPADEWASGRADAAEPR